MAYTLVKMDENKKAAPPAVAAPASETEPMKQNMEIDTNKVGQQQDGK